MLNNIPKGNFLLLCNEGLYLISSTILTINHHQVKEEVLREYKELASLTYKDKDGGKA